MTAPPPGWLEINADFDVDGEHRQMTVFIPPEVAWRIFEAVAIIGPDRAVHLLQLGGEIARKGMKTYDGMSEKDEGHLMARFVIAIAKRVLGRDWNDQEDRVLSFMYYLLQESDTSWIAAAHFTSQALGQQITTGALRKRLERWAEREGRPKIEKYRPRAVKVTE